MTLFTSLHLTGDSLPLFQIHEEENILHIRGNGNPVFLHPDFSFLQKDWKQKLQLDKYDTVIIHERSLDNKRFGPGWAWDDYPYYFQAEISGFPVFGNSLWVRWDPDVGMLQFSPEYVGGFVSVQTKVSHSSFRVRRDEFANSFTIEMGRIPEMKERRSAPFLVDPYTLTQILQDTMATEISYQYSNEKLDWIDFYPVPLDSVYRKMMFESDNFVAEQLLLASSGKIFNTLSTDSVIHYVKQNYFKDYADSIHWVDGSGLSRYNLTSPSFNTYVLSCIVKDFGVETVNEFLPEIGKQGNVIEGYQSLSELNIHVKSGSFKHHYALSGMIVRDEQTVFFSIMYDNFLASQRAIKSEIINVLKSLDHMLKN